MRVLPHRTTPPQTATRPSRTRGRRFPLAEPAGGRSFPKVSVLSTPQADPRILLNESMIEQKGRAVDQGPGDVLRGGEPPDGGLLDAHLQVAAAAERARVGRTGFLANSSRCRSSLSLGSIGSGALLAVNASDLAAGR